MTHRALRIAVSAFAAWTLCVVGASGRPLNALPKAIWTDPPADAAHPASGMGVQFISHGETVNAQLYRPAGAGSHPTVVLLHGLPGNEQNLDLAQVLRRVGYTVITFHYRGSWGSAGPFDLKNAAEDTEALLALLKEPHQAVAWNVDPLRIILIGHSYGGWAAAKVLADTPGLTGAVLIAPWDISYDARNWKKLSSDARSQAARVTFDDVEGRLAGATPESLADQAVRDGPAFDLAALAPKLASQRLLIVTATRDDPDDKAESLITGLKAAGTKTLRIRSMDTDHGFNDHRIALEVEVLGWLKTLGH